jgi:ABC-type multidrug transport system ATPase subunit
MMDTSILSLTQIHKQFGRNKVLRDVSLELKKGDSLGFLGPNGAGKTTLIRIILGLVRADHGTVAINGYPMHRYFKRAIAGVGSVVETPRFYNYLNARQNLQLTCNLHPGSATRMNGVLKTVGLQDRAHDKVGTYSLGMKQRLGLARALITHPSIIFLDEPMNGLDPQGIIETRGLIRTLQREHGISFFITSHLLSEVEQVCDQIAIIQEGAIVAQGELTELLTRTIEVVDIYTPKVEEALTLLRRVDFVRQAKMEENRILAEIDHGRSADVNRLLGEHNIPVSYLVPKKTSLEELFMELTQGGAHERIN